MVITYLALTDFKNYRSAQIDLDDHINCFVGPNGSGKTNLLDAIHYLCLCKSYFNPLDSQNINHDASGFNIKGRFSSGNVTDEISCSVGKGKRKTMSLGGKKYDKLAEHVGRIPAVVVAPDDLTLVTGGSAERRRMMDHALVQTDPLYLSDLAGYTKALKQRNATLRGFDPGQVDTTLLESWNEKLVPLGTAIYEKRQHLVNSLEGPFKKLYEKISGGREAPGLEYTSHLQEAGLADLLAQSQDKDAILRRTTKGIHADEIKFLQDGHVVKRFSSQGQRKSFLIALKLALYAQIRDVTHKEPLLLLDDIFDKLDRDRITNLMSIITGEGYSQIILTDTNEIRIDELFGSLDLDVKKFRIEGGEIS